MTSFAPDPTLLAKLPLFSALTEAQLTWVWSAVKHRPYPARTCMLRAGEPPDGLNFILSGTARIVHEDGQGRELIANVIGRNEFFGEMGLLDAAPCPASVHSIEPCEILHVPRRIALECMEDNAAAASSMLKCVLERLCRAHVKMANLALVNVYGRVAQLLLETGQDADGEWPVGLRAEDIAALVGASREMVSRVLRSMIERGAVRRYKRKLIVKDRSALVYPGSRDL